VRAGNREKQERVPSPLVASPKIIVKARELASEACRLEGKESSSLLAALSVHGPGVPDTVEEHDEMPGCFDFQRSTPGSALPIGHAEAGKARVAICSPEVRKRT
jgi:hypothetical protein